RVRRHSFPTRRSSDLRAGADAGGVGLGDAEDVVQVQRAEAGTGGGAAGGGAGAGHVRVGAVVDVQQRALGALEHDVGAGLAQLVPARGDVGDHGLVDFRIAQGLVQG